MLELKPAPLFLWHGVLARHSEIRTHDPCVRRAVIYMPMIVGARAFAASTQPFFLKDLVFRASVTTFAIHKCPRFSGESLTHRKAAHARSHRVRRAGLSGTTHLPGFLKPAARHAEQPYPNRTVMIARELWVYAAYRKSQIAEGSASWSSGPCPRTAQHYGAP